MWAEEDAGWSVLQMLKMDRVTGQVPIILCTGAKREVSQLNDHLTRMDVSVVLKPFDIDTQLDVIVGHLADAPNGRSREVAQQAEPSRA